MTTALLPELTTAYPLGDDDIAAYRTNGHVRLTQLATVAEAVSYTHLTLPTICSV